MHVLHQGAAVLVDDTRVSDNGILVSGRLKVFQHHTVKVRQGSVLAAAVSYFFCDLLMLWSRIRRLLGANGARLTQLSSYMFSTLIS